MESAPEGRRLSFLGIRPQCAKCDIRQHHCYAEKEMLYFQSITLVQLFIASWIVACKLGMLTYTNIYYFWLCL